MIATAETSPCGTYRYRLGRRWAEGRTLGFVLLNPSVADALRDDPTVRRCVGYGRTLGYGGLEIANLFALRATDPSALGDHPDPIGPENDRHTLDVSGTCDLVICGWGAYHDLRGRDLETYRLLSAANPFVYCLGLTAGGHPRHPLYLRKDLRPVPYEGPRP